MTTTNTGCCEKCKVETDGLNGLHVWCCKEMCDCHQQAGEGWAERFDAQFPEFGYPRGTRNARMKSFIASEIAAVREEEINVNVTPWIEQGRAAMKAEIGEQLMHLIAKHDCDNETICSLAEKVSGVARSLLSQ